MGRIMQKGLVRKLELEMFLSQIEPPLTPKPSLEQYTIPVNVAATILYIAAYTYNDIINKTVLDLGCGTGRLALGAAFLGAKNVVGVDIDRSAVEMAFENSLKTNLKSKMEWINADIDVIHGKFDTVLQNPPFGVQKPKADRRFLQKALETGKVVYSLHKSPHMDKLFSKKLKARKNGIIPIAPSPFFKKFIEAHGGKIRAVYATVMTIPHMFSFHTKRKHEFVAELYIIGKG
ncbi:MAG: METTL5 family protein [Candidatus Bathycorpusculaceae bacterium]